MAHRASSSSPFSSPRPEKRQKLNHLTSESFRKGVMLAPMVRSGTLPTRLMSLKHGATLVWSPEVVDKAILHAEREVDPLTGVISYNGVTTRKTVFSIHPIEKPYLIYQIGSADPELAVQAAKTVQQDISGIDLNCGCPKSFSTHAGMGAALLTNPDLLCSILTALRTAMPSKITVSAKIRLLPDQKDTLNLVERIVNTGISNLPVHCQMGNMRPRKGALIYRIVEFVESIRKGVTVIENGDCLNRYAYKTSLVRRCSDVMSTREVKVREDICQALFEQISAISLGLRGGEVSEAGLLSPYCERRTERVSDRWTRGKSKGSYHRNRPYVLGVSSHAMGICNAPGTALSVFELVLDGKNQPQKFQETVPLILYLSRSTRLLIETA